MRKIGRILNVGMKILKFNRWEMCLEMGNLVIEETDAIINPANKHLLHGGGVAGAIVKVGGKAQQDLSNLWISENGYLDPTNEDFRRSTAFTPATEYLECKNVIHTVGPNLSGIDVEDIPDEVMEVHDSHLKNAITSALQRAEDLGCSSVASPAISADRCAKIMVESTIEYLESTDSDSSIELVKFIMTEEEMYEYFEEVMEKVE